MSNNVTIDYKYYYLGDDGCQDHVYITTRDISDTDSLRKIAQAINQEIIGVSDAPSWDKVPVAISLHSGVSENNSAYGIPYGLRDDGGIIFLEGYSPLSHDYTYGEIKELQESEYIKGDIKHLEISMPQGLGAAGSVDYFQIIYSIVIGISSTALWEFSKYGVKTLKNKLSGEQEKITLDWSKRGIRDPKRIREFFATKPYWTLTEVKKRFMLNDEMGINFLKKLGYGEKDSCSERGKTQWGLCQDRESTEYRKEWLRFEDEVERQINGQFEDFMKR